MKKHMIFSHIENMIFFSCFLLFATDIFFYCFGWGEDYTFTMLQFFNTFQNITGFGQWTNENGFLSVNV